MKIKASVNDPDAIDVTLTITMPLAHWRRLAKDLPTTHPSWKLGAAITSVIYKVQRESVEAVEAEEA